MSNIKDNVSDRKESTTKEALDDRRLWIGNLDPRVTEYQLLKLIQQHGAIEKFDLLFHRAGPLAGQPRGYAFVTFVNKEDAVMAKVQLHSKLVGTKNIVVTWAHSISGEEPGKPKNEIVIPALAMAKSETKINRESQIEAIEAKLKLMERKDAQELEINKTVSAEPPIILYQNKKQDAITMTTSGGSGHSNNRHLSALRRNEKRRVPYKINSRK